MGWTRKSAAVSVLLAMDEHRKQAGARVLQLREARHWTHEDLAHAAGLSVKTVSRFEKGRNEGRRSTVRKLAKALDVTEQYIIGEPPAPLGLRRDTEAEDPVTILKQLLERQEALELAVAALAEQIAADRRQAPPRRRRSS